MLILIITSLVIGIVIVFFSISSAVKPGEITLPEITVTPTTTLIPPATPALNSVFIDPLASGSSVPVNTFGEGQICGGLVNTPCPPEFYCKREENGRESSGFCTKL